MPKKQTDFGKHLDGRPGSFDQAAKELGLTTAYVRMLANGSSTPKLGLAGKIENWSGGEVKMQSWLPFCRGYRKSSAHVG